MKGKRKEAHVAKERAKLDAVNKAIVEIEKQVLELETFIRQVMKTQGESKSIIFCSTTHSATDIDWTDIATKFLVTGFCSRRSAELTVLLEKWDADTRAEEEKKKQEAGADLPKET